MSSISSQYSSQIIASKIWYQEIDTSKITFIGLLLVSICTNWFVGSMNYQETLGLYCEKMYWNNQGINIIKSNITVIEIWNNSLKVCTWLMYVNNFFYWLNSIVQLLMLLNTMLLLVIQILLEKKDYSFWIPSREIFASLIRLIFVFWTVISLLISSREYFVPTTRISLLLLTAFFYSPKMKYGKKILLSYVVIMLWWKEFPCNGQIQFGTNLQILITQNNQETCEYYLHLIYYSHLCLAAFIWMDIIVPRSREVSF